VAFALIGLAATMIDLSARGSSGSVLCCEWESDALSYIRCPRLITFCLHKPRSACFMLHVSVWGGKQVYTHLETTEHVYIALLLTIQNDFVRNIVRKSPKEPVK
jgi:hypothetical protein